MKTTSLLFAFIALAALPLLAMAQTNSDTAPTPAGPVVMPPPDQAPPPPADQTAAAAPAPDPTAGAQPPSSTPSLPPSANIPGTITSGTSPASSQDEIEDIRPPLFFLVSWWPWVLLALGVLALIGLVLLIWKIASRKGQLSPKNAYELALDKLERARPLMREEDPTPYAVAVSEAIRAYLGQRFHSPSDRRTTEEFLRQMQEDTATPLAEHAELLGIFLRACDMVKFARYQPSMVELEEVQQRAVNFVTATKPIAAAEQAKPPLAPAPATP